MAWIDFRTSTTILTLSGPVTNWLRYMTRAFCTTRLLDATPRTMPRDRQSVMVLVTTACSSCSLRLRRAINAPGKRNPWPALEGTRKRKYTQLGIPIFMHDRQVVPVRRSRVPETRGHLRRLDHEIRKPVETPAMVADMEGTISRRPLLVALSRRTAWK